MHFFANYSSKVYFAHTSEAKVSKCLFISILLKKKYRATPLVLRVLTNDRRVLPGVEEVGNVEAVQSIVGVGAILDLGEKKVVRSTGL